MPLRAVPVLIYLPIIAGLTACQPAGSAADRARAENMMLLSVGSEPPTLDPHRNTAAPSAFIINALWDPLVVWNPAGTDVAPASAERWELSADGRTYTFHLRRDAKWSNGLPVTAQDWVGSLRRWVTPSLGAELANYADPVLGVDDFRHGRTIDPTTLGFRAPDDHTLVIELTAPYAGFLEGLTGYPWVPVYRPDVEAAGGLANPMADFVRPGELVSNGAYVLTAWRHDQYVEVRRSPTYYDPARLEAMRFLAIDSLDTMERAFRGGQLHVTDGVPPSKIEAYQAAGDPALRITPRIGLRYLSFNTQRPPFDDPRVRRAFSLALNRRKICDAVLRNGCRPAWGMIEAFPGGYQSTTLLHESIDEARALLAAAGYPDGAGFPPTEYLYNTLDLNRSVAEALQQMWRAALNVDLTLRNEDWKVFLSTRHQLDYQVSRSGWLPFTPQPDELYTLVSTSSPSNETGWSHPAFDAALAQARRTLDPVARAELYATLDTILRDEMPIVPFAFYSRARLIDPAVDGWTGNPIGSIVWKRVGFRPGP